MLMPTGDCFLPEFSLENRKKKDKEETGDREKKRPSKKDRRMHLTPGICTTILNLCQ